MVDMINKHVLPSAKAAELPQVAALEAALDTLGKAIDEIHASSGKPQADLARTLRLETMIDIREVCDAAEGSCRRDNQITRRLRDNQITRRLPTVCARSNRLFTQACARPTSGRSRPTRTCSSSTRPRTSTRTTSLRAARSRAAPAHRGRKFPPPLSPPGPRRERPNGVVYIDAKDYLSISRPELPNIHWGDKKFKVLSRCVQGHSCMCPATQCAR